MHELLAQLAQGVPWTGDLRADVNAFLTHHGFAGTAEHCMRVAEVARRLAIRFDQDVRSAMTAAWLHDASAVVPNHRRAAFARELHIPVLPEEEMAPMILHQKLSAAIAAGLFNVSDQAILSAIGCHTTLKAGATPLDKIVFVADKIAWDQPGSPPFLERVLAGLEHSLDWAVFQYLEHLWQRRRDLQVVHPWLVHAYAQLAETLDRPAPDSDRHVTRAQEASEP